MRTVRNVHLRPLRSSGLMALAALGGAAVLAAAAELALGPSHVPLTDVLAALSGRPTDQALIILDVRLPRMLTAASVGALLGVSGALLQGLLRNPLAEPYLLGVSSGAALAVAVAIVSGMPAFILGMYAFPPVAFLGAMGALVGVALLARVRGRMGTTTLILAGVVVQAVLSAGVMLIAYASGSRHFEVVAWLMGHLQPMTLTQVWWTGVSAVAGTAVALGQSRDLNALSLGEDAAASMGVGVEAAKRRVFLLASLLTGIAVSASGLIGFVGLIAPHVVRLTTGANNRWLIPGSAFAGAALLLLADVVSRTVAAPAELPAGVVTALLGGPFFLVLLVRHARASVPGARHP